MINQREDFVKHCLQLYDHSGTFEVRQVVRLIQSVRICPSCMVPFVNIDRRIVHCNQACAQRHRRKPQYVKAYMGKVLEKYKENL